MLDSCFTEGAFKLSKTRTDHVDHFHHYVDIRRGVLVFRLWNHVSTEH